MRKASILLSSSILIFCGSAHTQPVLTGAANNPVAGDAFLENVCDTAGITEGVSGAGITWDFSGLVSSGYDTMSYVACSSTTNCSQFPGSNLAWAPNVGTGPFYYATNPDSFYYYGRCNSSGSCIPYSNPQVFMQYPFTYNSGFIDSSGFSNYGVDNLSLINCDTVVCDGYGTLILPGHTYTNVLRIHDYQSTTDSNDLAGGWQAISYQRTYKWYIPGVHYTLMNITYYSQPFPPGITKSVAYYNQLADESVSAITNGIALLQLFPNPVNNELNINFTTEDDQDIRISLLDIVGKEIMVITDKQFEKGSQHITCSVASLSRGVYLVRFQTGNGTITKKIEVL